MSSAKHDGEQDDVGYRKGESTKGVIVVLLLPTTRVPSSLPNVNLIGTFCIFRLFNRYGRKVNNGK
jgi:hypothetical protein